MEARRRAAASIAVALRQALTERIGVEEREVGWSSFRDAQTEAGMSALSILLFDTATGGAGFVGQGVRHLPELLRRSRQILMCPRNCDSACHACLVTYDTSHHVKDLHRHDALRVLSESFVASLELPTELRVFGDDTRYEYDPIVVALEREARWATVIRLHVGGVPAEWDLEEWPLQRHIARWVSDGIRVQVICERSTLSRLDVHARNRLSSMVEAGHVIVVERSRSSAVPTLIAEVSGSAQSVRFAVIEPEAVTPKSTWGRGPQGARIVSVQRSEPLSELEDGDAAITASALRATPQGAVAALTFGNELAGPVRTFGNRFWRAVLDKAPDFQRRLQLGDNIGRIEYQDRYIKSPLVMRLVIELLRGLKELGGDAMRSARVVVATREPDTRSNNRLEPRSWREDWPSAVRRGDIFATAMAASGLTGDWEERRWTEAQHARELLVTWHDGAHWKLRLDEGLGFIEADRRIGFDFRAAVRDQGLALARAEFGVQARSRSHGYVFPVGKAP
jgi:hypothetical protein